MWQRVHLAARGDEVFNQIFGIQSLEELEIHCDRIDAVLENVGRLTRLKTLIVCTSPKYAGNTDIMMRMSKS